MSDTLTSSKIVDTMHSKLGFSKREAKELLGLFLDTIAEVLEKGEPVRIAGFGVFKVLEKGARPGRNPATGEVVMVDARRVVVFHASKTWSRSIPAKN